MQRRLLVFAAAVLAPVLIGALTCGVLVMFSAARSQALAEEMVAESAVSVSLFHNLELARIAGSRYVTIPKLDRIVLSGVQLTLDDFGEGYSSLSHLQRLPVQGLKIARPFVKGLADPHADSRLVRGIIELAHSLELNLVAEGIELTEQRDALKTLGCRLGQGFLFARPLPLPAFRAVMDEQQRPATLS